MQKLQMKIDSPVCPLYIVASSDALMGVYWRKQNVPMIKADEPHKVFKQTITQLNEYFSGKRQTFSLPLKTKGTAFQEKVWQELARIPYGETRSYQEIAIKIRHPKAYRAVGTANGCNPLSIIVPCHRVIAADGTMGGFGGGLKVKRMLLELEGKL